MISCQYKLLKKTSAGHYRGTIGLIRVRIEIKHNYVPVFYRRMKYTYSSWCVKFIPTRTRTYILFCDKTRVPMFYFLSIICFSRNVHVFMWLIYTCKLIYKDKPEHVLHCLGFRQLTRLCISWNNSLVWKRMETSIVLKWNCEKLQNK